MVYLNQNMLPHKPGVYRFLEATGKILYVGKARDLKKRVSQYYRKNIRDQKTRALMSQASAVEYTITENENQALLLECALIKKHRPKYNVLMRDDKSYPYLFLSEHNYPMLAYRRRRRKKDKGVFFGPYPNAGSVRDNLALIQKLFQLRNCTDSFFAHRSRPCLQYQIGRCTAPCVAHVSQEDYATQVSDAIGFLRGKRNALMRSLKERMKVTAEERRFEEAAHWRDLWTQLKTLSISRQEQAWVKQVEDDLEQRYSQLNRTQVRMQVLQKVLCLSTPLRRIECFDISHTQGVLTKASCVVFGESGAQKSDYRQFNIDNIKPGDDYAAMQQVLTRRYARTQELPDLLIVDGGRGQMSIAAKVLAELPSAHSVLLMGVAKGRQRKAGLERLFIYGKAALLLAEDDPARLLIQEIRDEAHRFAIQAHRNRRDKASS